MIDRDILVYIADDDDDDRLIFVESITEISENIAFKEASDGLKLITLLSENNKLPDIIFLDLNMPFQNGRETLRKLRSNKAYDHIPVVVYSTSTNPSDIEETYLAGASLYLEKPYSMDDMMKKLKVIFSLKWYSGRKINRKNYFISSKESSLDHFFDH
jgi:CheY-like chemotaxis protein